MVKGSICNLNAGVNVDKSCVGYDSWKELTTLS